MCWIESIGGLFMIKKYEIMTIEQLEDEIKKVLARISFVVSSGETTVISHWEIEEILTVFREMKRRIKNQQ